MHVLAICYLVLLGLVILVGAEYGAEDDATKGGLVLLALAGTCLSVVALTR